MRKMGSVPIFLLALAGSAGAEPVKCVDASGKVRYVDSSAKGDMKCEPVRGSANFGVGEGRAKPAPSPAQKKGAPPMSEAERRAAIAEAEKDLEEKKRALAAQEATREGGERNYARVEERLAPYREAVQNAQRYLEDVRSSR